MLHILFLLLSCWDSNSSTSLREGPVAEVNKFMKELAEVEDKDINKVFTRDGKEYTWLMFAAENGDKELIKAVMDRNPDYNVKVLHPISEEKREKHYNNEFIKRCFGGDKDMKKFVCAYSLYSGDDKEIKDAFEKGTRFIVDDLDEEFGVFSGEIPSESKVKTLLKKLMKKVEKDPKNKDRIEEVKELMKSSPNEALVDNLRELLLSNLLNLPFVGLADNSINGEVDLFLTPFKDYKDRLFYSAVNLRLDSGDKYKEAIKGNDFLNVIIKALYENKVDMQKEVISSLTNDQKDLVLLSGLVLSNLEFYSKEYVQTLVREKGLYTAVAYSGSYNVTRLEQKVGKDFLQGFEDEKILNKTPKEKIDEVEQEHEGERSYHRSNQSATMFRGDDYESKPSKPKSDDEKWNDLVDSFIGSITRDIVNLVKIANRAN